MDHTILVTGAAGFAGSHLLDLLEGGPARLVPWRRPAEPFPPGRTGDDLPWMSVELLDRDAVAAAVAEVRPDAVFHLAGAAHVGHAWDRTRDTLAANVLATHHLLVALRRAGLRPRVLITGSALVYRPSATALHEDDPLGPSSPYGVSKLAQELLGRRAAGDEGLPVIVTRPFNHVGPRQHPSFFTSSFARQIALIETGGAGAEMTVGNLEARRDLTDVRDTVRAYRALIERGRPGEVYNVCSGRAYRVGDILDRLLAKARVPISVRSDAALHRPNDTPLVAGSWQRIHRETGWEPVIPIERTLDDLLAYWRAAIAAGA